MFIINNPTNDRILTSRDSTTTGIDAETNLTFDGQNLILDINKLTKKILINDVFYGLFLSTIEKKENKDI
jgi:hypothetical protein